MIPKTEKCATGWYVQVWWDYEGNDHWSGPFKSESTALDWFYRHYG